MFDYKDIPFYNEYFSNLKDYRLVDPFHEENTENGRYFIATIQAIESVHPLEIQVEIPAAFPHHKLMFYTESLYGYPHLIPCTDRKNMSWFCLNTPFAESTRAQLDLELSRLKEWKDKVMQKGLPAKITDIETILSLSKIYAYAWENTDEIREYSNCSNACFIGDFANENNLGDHNTGHINCIKNDSNNYYLVNRKSKAANLEVPYIIVEETPKNNKDFFALVRQYNWSTETCDFLLPGFSAHPGRVSEGYRSVCLGKIPEDEALKKLNEALSNLVIKDAHRTILTNTIEELKSQIKEQHYYQSRLSLDDLSDEALMQEEYFSEIYPYIYSYFLLGVKESEKLHWYWYGTNRNLGQAKTTKYNLGIESIGINELVSWPIFVEKPKLVKEDNYFGRGCFDDALTNLNIAIIGLGAVGSQVANSLVRSGVRCIGLWDNDIVEPGNICRSTYTLQNMGDSKVQALSEQLKSINPYISVETHGHWPRNSDINLPASYVHGDFYGNVNYDSQSEAVTQLEKYDLIIDCTASNELLHFLSYAFSTKHIVSLSITNHADNLLLFSNHDGNPFELRKAYLSKIEQDTHNFYAEGSGCFSPTFLALNCDIASLVNLSVKEIGNTIGKGLPLHSIVWSYDRRGILADRLNVIPLYNSSITMTISSETLMDAEELDDLMTGPLGYILGTYSSDGKSIMATHCVGSEDAGGRLADAFRTSNGILDYIGEIWYSKDESGQFDEQIIDILAQKSANPEIDTNNPLLGVRTPSGQIKFYLYMNGEMIPFENND